MRKQKIIPKEVEESFKKIDKKCKYKLGDIVELSFENKYFSKKEFGYGMVIGYIPKYIPNWIKPLGFWFYSEEGYDYLTRENGYIINFFKRKEKIILKTHEIRGINV